MTVPLANMAVPALLPFDVEQCGPTIVTFKAILQSIFKPEGLLLWNVTELDEVSIATIGKMVQLVAYFAPIPAAWFATGWSYEEVERRVQLGKYPASWGRWNTAEPGMIVRIEVAIKDPATKPERVRALIWGREIR